jgi:Ca2+-transporting ATPase
VKATRRQEAVTPLFVDVPGRARLRVAGLRGRPLGAYHLEDRLNGHAAIRKARASPLTGNLLVLFDAERLGVDDLIREVVRHWNQASRVAGGNGERDSPAIDLAPSTEHPAWHSLTREPIVARVGTSPDRGLSVAEAAERLSRVGPNRLPVSAPRSTLAILVDQVASLPVLLLAGAAALSIASGALLDAAVILAVVAINAAVGCAMETRAQAIIASLNKLAVPMALVRRDGKELVIPAAELVPGDLMVLRAGYDVPADGRLIQASGLAINESALTGESVSAVKSAETVCPERALIADRANMVFTGTVVTDGAGVAVVTETGRKTELGRVRALVAEAAAPPTPLERQLDAMGRQLVGVSAALCGVAFGLGLLRGVPPLEMLRTAISLAVAAVPEGLPAVATTTLALGMRRMLRRNTLVRRLAAVQALGSTTVICVDKTGTITENRMTVGVWHLDGRDLFPVRDGGLRDAAGRAIRPGEALGPALERALGVAVLCNEAELIWKDGRAAGIDGSSTEGALLVAALELGIDYRELRPRFPLLSVRPRAEGENWMSTVHAAAPGRRLMMVKGAPEELLRRSASCLRGVLEEPLTPADRRAILTANARMADRGMRVLGLAFAELEEDAQPPWEALVWIGLVGLVDPIREGVREAIAACHTAGIRTVIITGDQSQTAVAVGRELGLVRDGHVRVLEASQLARVSPDVLRGLAREIDVFARVSPTHKYQIVRALQAGGQVVAMTGDGVNDAPALKAADIGVALGARGTDLARDLADVVLLDDDFGSIVDAIEQGRVIYANVGKSLRFLLATNLSEVLVTVGAIALGVARPMNALQFLWINLLTDVFPALALAFEPADTRVMTEPPRDPTRPILSRAALTRVAGDAGLISAATLGAYGAALARSGVGASASTVAFTTLTTAQLAYALRCRSDEGSAFSALGRNHWLLGALGGTLALQIAAVAVPALRRVLGTTPLGLADWGLVAAGAAGPLVAGEVQTWMRRNARVVTGGPERERRSGRDRLAAGPGQEAERDRSLPVAGLASRPPAEEGGARA